MCLTREKRMTAAATAMNEEVEDKWENAMRGNVTRAFLIGRRVDSRRSGLCM